MKIARNSEDNIATQHAVRTLAPQHSERHPKTCGHPKSACAVMRNLERSSGFELRVICVKCFFLHYFASCCRHNEAYVLRKLAYTWHVRIRDTHALIFGGKFMHVKNSILDNGCLRRVAKTTGKHIQIWVASRRRYVLRNASLGDFVVVRTSYRV
jgi:hypothetical protein